MRPDNMITENIIKGVGMHSLQSRHLMKMYNFNYMNVCYFIAWFLLYHWRDCKNMEGKHSREPHGSYSAMLFAAIIGPKNKYVLSFSYLSNLPKFLGDHRKNEDFSYKFMWNFQISRKVFPQIENTASLCAGPTVWMTKWPGILDIYLLVMLYSPWLTTRNQPHTSWRSAIFCSWGVHAI